MFHTKKRIEAVMRYFQFRSWFVDTNHLISTMFIGLFLGGAAG